MFFAGIGTAVPSRRYTQKECWEALQRSPQFAVLKPRSKATLQHVLLSDSNGIRTRHLALEALEEAFETDADTLHARFARHAPELAAAAARSALRDADLQPRDVDAVLVSTCTGYLCPGLTGYVGERLASRLGGLSWPATYVTLIALYVAIHYLFVSQSSQALALLGVFLDVGVRGGVPAPLMAYGLLFATCYFSVITPQGGSQNIIFAASGYLTQRELYTLGFFTTLFFLAVFLVIGTPWVLFVTR